MRNPSVSREDWPYRSSFVELDGARLHYVDTGQGDPILMLPGSPMWSFMYRHVIGKLATNHRCIAVDLPGLGLSHAPLSDNHAFSRNATLLQRLVNHLGLENMTVMMHATAGPSAVAMALRERSRVRRLVICNSFAWPLDGGDAPTRLKRIVRVVSSRLFGWLNVHLNLLPRVAATKGRHRARFTPSEQSAILAPFQNKNARRHLQELLTSIRTESCFLADIQRGMSALRDVPALILYGRHDNGYAAGFIDRWRELFPDHRADVLDAGHFLVEDDPHGFSARVGQFLAEA